MAHDGIHKPFHGALSQPFIRPDLLAKRPCRKQASLCAATLSQDLDRTEGLACNP